MKSLLVLVLWGGISLPVLAVARPPGPHPPHGERLERLIEALGLDEETLTEVNKVIAASKAQHQELRRKLREAHRHMHTLLAQEDPDEAEIMAQADIIGVLRTEAQK